MLGDGISRNAVIGKSHRLGLQGRAQSRMISAPRINNRVINENNAPTRQRRPRGLRAIVIEKDFEPENPIPLEKLTDKVCRWPIGHPDEKDFYFCGRSAMDDRAKKWSTCKSTGFSNGSSNSIPSYYWYYYYTFYC